MREIDRQIEQFLTHCSMKQLSKKTLKAYNQTLYLMANYLEQVHSITSAEQVKAFHISAYIGYLQERGKYTVACSCNHTQQNYLRLLHLPTKMNFCNPWQQVSVLVLPMTQTLQI